MSLPFMITYDTLLVPIVWLEHPPSAEDIAEIREYGNEHGWTSIAIRWLEVVS